MSAVQHLLYSVCSTVLPVSVKQFASILFIVLSSYTCSFNTGYHSEEMAKQNSWYFSSALLSCLVGAVSMCHIVQLTWGKTYGFRMTFFPEVEQRMVLNCIPEIVLDTMHNKRTLMSHCWSLQLFPVLLTIHFLLQRWVPDWSIMTGRVGARSGAWLS